MMILTIIIAIVASSAMAQDILEVLCGYDAITARFNTQTAVAAGFQMKDLHFNDPECGFDKEEDGYYVKTIDPVESCGTEVVANDTHVSYTNSISTTDWKTELSFPHGIIIGHSENQMLISVMYECTYEIDLRLSTSFIPNNTFVSIPIPAVIGEGVFQVAMAIYKSGSYREVYSGAPSLPSEETVFVGITVVDDASSDLFILMRTCWATVIEDPDSDPQNDLIMDSCPVTDDALNDVRVGQNGINQQALWQTEMSKLFGKNNYNSVWIHCNISICVQETCPVDCGARRRRRSIRNRHSVDANTYTVTVGPVTKSPIDLPFPEPTATAVAFIRNETAYEGNITKQEQLPQTGGTDHTLLYVMGAFAAFCIVCMGMTFAVLSRSN